MWNIKHQDLFCTFRPARLFYIRNMSKDYVMDVTKDEASAGAKVETTFMLSIIFFTLGNIMYIVTNSFY